MHGCNKRVEQGLKARQRMVRVPPHLMYSYFLTKTDEVAIASERGHVGSTPGHRRERTGCCWERTGRRWTHLATAALEPFEVQAQSPEGAFINLHGSNNKGRSYSFTVMQRHRYALPCCSPVYYILQLRRLDGWTVVCTGYRTVAFQIFTLSSENKCRSSQA